MKTAWLIDSDEEESKYDPERILASDFVTSILPALSSKVMMDMPEEEEGEEEDDANLADGE